MEEGGFVDLALSLISHERLSNGVQVCVARGVHNGTEVGFRFRLPPAWKQGTLGDTGITTYQSTLDVESVGAASDDFVAILANLYGGPLRPEKMAPSTTFTAISLQGIPAQLEAGSTKIKLFFEPKEDSDEAYERDYAEHYLNIDFASRVVEFHEKDPEYRDAMLRALSGVEQP